MTPKVWVLVAVVMGFVPGFAVGATWGALTGQWVMVGSMYAAWLFGVLACLLIWRVFERGRSRTWPT